MCDFELKKEQQKKESDAFLQRKQAMSEETILARKGMSAKKDSENENARNKTEGAKYYEHYYEWKYTLAVEPLTRHMEGTELKIDATNVEGNKRLKKQLKSDFSNISGRSVKRRMKKVKKMNKLMNEISQRSADEENMAGLSQQNATVNETESLKTSMKRITNSLKILDASREYQHEFIKAYGKKDATENEKLAQINYEFAVKKGSFLTDYETFFETDEERQVSPEIKKLRKKYDSQIKKLIADNRAEQMKYLKDYNNTLKENGVSSSEAIINLNKLKIKEIEEVTRQNAKQQKDDNDKLIENKVWGPYIKMAIGLRRKTTSKYKYEGVTARLYRFNRDLTEDARDAMQRIINGEQDNETIAKNIADLLWEIQTDKADSGNSVEEVLRAQNGEKLFNVMMAYVKDHSDIWDLVDDAWTKKQQADDVYSMQDLDWYVDNKAVAKYTLKKETKKRMQEESEEREKIRKAIEAKYRHNEKWSYGTEYKSAEFTKNYKKAVSVTPIIDVDQRSFQEPNSKRCWAYAISNMLKARGMTADVEPEQIAQKAKDKASEKIKDRINKFDAFDIDELKDVISEYLPDQYKPFKSTVVPIQGEGGKFQVKMKLMEIINHALKDGSTVAINLPNEGHYVTIVGMINDKDKETILFKDSKSNGANVGSNFIRMKKLDTLIENLYAGKDGQTNLYWFGKKTTDFSKNGIEF